MFRAFNFIAHFVVLFLSDYTREYIEHVLENQ